MTGPYVIQNTLTGDFWQEPAPGQRTGTWCDQRAHATAYPRRQDIDQALAAVRVKFQRHNRPYIQAQQLHPAPVFDPMRRHPSGADLTLPLNFEGVAA